MARHKGLSRSGYGNPLEFPVSCTNNSADRTQGYRWVHKSLGFGTLFAHRVPGEDGKRGDHTYVLTQRPSPLCCRPQRGRRPPDGRRPHVLRAPSVPRPSRPAGEVGQVHGEEIIPFQVKMGMVILGSFVGEEDASVYVWIRRFENEAERKRLYDAVYQSDYWKNEIAPHIPTLIDREQIKVTRIVATPHSVIQ